MKRKTNKIDEDEWNEVIKLANIITEEVIEKKLDSFRDKSEIKLIIRNYIHETKKIQEIIQEFPEKIDIRKAQDLQFCKKFRHFFTNLNEKSQQIFFSTAIDVKGIEILKKILKTKGIKIRKESLEDSHFEIIRVCFPENLCPKQFSAETHKIFLYIKKEDKIFDFSSTLFERLVNI